MGDNPDELLLIGESSWHLYDMTSATVRSEKAYDDRKLLKHRLTSDRLCFLQVTTIDAVIIAPLKI